MTQSMKSSATSQSATSQSALQLHSASPKKLKHKSPGTDIRSSRYRLLDEREREHEAQEIKRIQEELRLHRRPRVVPTRSSSRNSSSSPMSTRQYRPTNSRREDSPPPYDSLYESGGRRSSKHDEPLSPQWTDGEDESAPITEEEEGTDKRNTGAYVLPSSFQQQVLRELEKLKQAQRKDLDIIQRLQREKEEAERRAIELEATLQKQTKSKNETTAKRGPSLAFEDLGEGDESAPPVESPNSTPRYQYPRRGDSDLDFTDGEEESVDRDNLGSGRWARSTASPPYPHIEASASPVFSSRKQQPRPVSARSAIPSDYRPLHGESRGPRPRSARSRNPAEEEETTRGRSRSRTSSTGSRSTSRPRSASRDELRRSCAFFEEKLKAKHEEEERERQARERLERASRATPPANLLKRQEEADRKKREQLRKIEKERNAELSPTKRAKAREVPLSTYTAAESLASNEEARKERVLKRSQDLMAHAELPTRMQQAKQQEEARAKANEAACLATATPMSVALAMSMATSVKARRMLQEQLDEEERRRQLMRPKPVPNFSHLQTQWEKSLSAKKSAHKPTEPQTFFSKRQKELGDIRARKEARKRKLAEQEEHERRQEAEKQRMLLEKARKTGIGGVDGPKLTKADELRMKKVQEALRQQRRAKEQEEMEKERREMRLKEASRRVAAQVKRGESKRKGDYAGNFVELSTVDSVAKERAKKQREQFREAVLRNKERLREAVATKPSLMERFTIDLQREEHRKNALEAVVKQVFQKNFKDMKGILTEEEEEVARDLVVAAEDDASSDTEAAAREEKEEDRDDEHYEDD